MSFKSEAQRKKLRKMAEEGKFPKEKLAEWEKATGEKKLPERATPPKIKHVK